MSVMTSLDMCLPQYSVANYFNSLINRFFKILPMSENHEESLGVYIQSLQCELAGCKSLMPPLQSDAAYITLLAILQYFADTPDSSVSVVRREVFRAIKLCEQLRDNFGGEEADCIERMA